MGGERSIVRSREWLPVEGMWEKTQLERDKEQHKEKEGTRDFNKEGTNDEADTKGTAGSELREKIY